MSREFKEFFPPTFGREKLEEEKTERAEREKAKQLGKQMAEARKTGQKEKEAELRTGVPERRVKIKEARLSAIEAREAMFDDVPDPALEKYYTDPEDLERELKERPELQKINLRTYIIDHTESYLKDLLVARKAFRHAKDPQEKTHWRQEFAKAKKKVDWWLADPKENLIFEKVYLKWMEGKQKYNKFRGLETKLTNIRKELIRPVFSGDTKEMSNENLARIERMSKREQQKIDLTVEEEKDALQYLYTETDLQDNIKQQELVAMMQEIEATKDTKAPKKKSKAELQQEKEKIEKELDKMWQDKAVQGNEREFQLNKLFKDLAAGKDVLEMPSTIHYLNRIAEWEKLHKRTTIGGVLVGEPGTGKTTLFHHYLEGEGRNYVYLDLSEEVTRYMLFGTKEIQFKSTGDYYEELGKKLEEMSEADFELFIKENAKRIQETIIITEEKQKKPLFTEKEAEAAAFQMIVEELGKAETTGEMSQEAITKTRELMQGKVSEAYRAELAKKFKHLVQKNGWRDGVIIAALRRGDSVILDEFVKCKDLTLLYGLTTAKPGEDWYFEDNDETIKIPETWRMYFTGNIGRRHKSFSVAEAFLSRAEGKIMTINYPPKAEELEVALAELCDVEGHFLFGGSKEEIAKMSILVDQFAGLRSTLKTKEGTLPISWRTIRDIGEKLVETTTDKYGRVTRQKTGKNIDQAIYEVLVESYDLIEDKSMPKTIVTDLTTAGLLLTDNLKEEITKTKAWITPTEFENCITKLPNLDEVIKKTIENLRGQRGAAFTAEIRPERRNK